MPEGWGGESGVDKTWDKETEALEKLGGEFGRVDAIFLQADIENERVGFGSWGAAKAKVVERGVDN